MVRVSEFTAGAVVLGTTLGLGLWSLASLAPSLSRPSLATRLAPYLVDVSAGARQLTDRRSSDPLPFFAVLFRPTVKAAARGLSMLLGGDEATARRLSQSRSAVTVERFRAQQLLVGVVGALVGCAVIVVVSLSAPIAPSAQLTIPLVFFGAGVLVRERLLTIAAKRRMKRIESELPTVLEFLTLSLSAGETALDAFRRVATISHGELAWEFSIVVAEVNAGVPVQNALRARSAALALPGFARLVEQISAAIERGTPLSEVLRAQAQDARDGFKRELLEVAGKKEVTMMIPLVFLILPITVVFALYPGIFVLQTGL